MESNDNYEIIHSKKNKNGIDLAELGTIVDVPTNWNYCYHSSLLVLTDIAKNNIKTSIDLRFKQYQQGNELSEIEKLCNI